MFTTPRPRTVIAVVEDRKVRELSSLPLSLSDAWRSSIGASRHVSPAGDDDLAVELLVLAAHRAVDRRTAGGVFEFRQHQRGEFSQVLNLRGDVERKLALPPFLLRRGQGALAVERHVIVPLVQRQLGNLDALIHQRGAEHERIPLARLPLKIRRVETQRGAGLGRVLRRAAEGEICHLDCAARGIGETEESDKRADGDLRELAVRLEGELAILRQRLRLRRMNPPNAAMCRSRLRRPRASCANSAERLRICTPGSSVTPANSTVDPSSFVVPCTPWKVRLSHGCLMARRLTAIRPGSPR